MACCLRTGSCENEKVGPVKKHFTFMFKVGDKLIGFTPIGPAQHINKPITKTFKGVVYTYLCADDGSVYSTDKLEVFEEGGG